MESAFLTQPMMLWTPGGWLISWFSSSTVSWLEVGDTPQRLERRSSRVSALLPPEDRDALPATRAVWRHQVDVSRLSGRDVWHRATMVFDGAQASSALMCSRRPDPGGGSILLTSDHQAMPLTAFAATAMGRAVDEPFQAVFYAGDCVNVPDRASEWFRLPAGNSFFECLQGTSTYRDDTGELWPGSPIAQACPLYTCVGNHEVMGRKHGRSLDHAFNEPVPRDIALEEFRRRCARDPTTEEDWRWVENNSWSIRTYQTIFGLEDTPGWYATRVGNVWLVSLFAARAWRPTEATVEPLLRTSNSRYHDAAGTQESAMERGYGSFPFVPVGKGSAQYCWLEEQLSSSERNGCRWTVVMLHEGPFSTGDNVMPPWCSPREVIEFDDSGRRVGTRYHYEQARNPLLLDLVPLFDEAGVDLVLSGHNHVWNRFTTPAGVHYLETSHAGNTYGSTEWGLRRARPPAPWASDEYLAIGSPAMAEPQPATAGGMRSVADANKSVFSVLNSVTGQVQTWLASPAAGLRLLDELTLRGPPITRSKTSS